ncbi:transmembrane protein 170A-like [Biomphalaria glabrata]|uniref:Transmembrane protein 170A-like n=2 Tax=Biomphalaria TaxID=6525 RepID=A0A9W3AWZ8_BIOGL|nr:transmembrane protein 170A-like [Biomphalaria glabrata]KAK0047902.1 transmembrane protein 170A [Biomphalaria pfeifferi]
MSSSQNTVLQVLTLSAPNLSTFFDIWYYIFLSALISSLFVHAVATLIAFLRLRKHNIGRWIPLAMLIMGFLSPLTGGVVSSAATAGVLKASDIVLQPLYAIIFGIAHTFMVVVVSFLRILATL